MAGNVFSFSNIGAPVQPLGAKREAPQDPMELLNGISAKHQVPANVIAAMAEAKGAKSMADLDAIAGSLAGEIGAGKDIGAILRENGGDGAVQRATEYADLLDPAGAQKPKAPEGGPSVAGNAARMAGYAAVSGLGGASDYIGSSIDRATEATIGPMVRAATGRTDEITLGADGLGAWGAEKLRGFAKDIGPSQEVFDKAADAMPTGNIADPSSWKGPKDFSLEGLTYAAAQGLGSLLPVVATAIATKNPAASMAVGGAMAGGDGRQTAADIIDGMWNEKLEDGTPRLAAESDVFRDLVAKGAPPEAAYAEVRTRAMNSAGDIQAIIGGAGGGVTGALVTNGLPKAIAGKTLAGNVARGVAGGALEEGFQEASETAGARYGINEAAGTNLDIGEGTVEAAAAGALAGGPFGALGARRTEQQAAEDQPAASPAPILALPAPNDGGNIYLGGPSDPSKPNPSGDGSAGGQAAAPTSQPGVAPSPGAGAAAEPTTPMGPIQRAASKAPDMTPQQQGPSLFPDMKPGTPVQLVDPETGEVQESAFLGEGPGFVTVRWNGEAIDITPQEFEASRIAAKQAANEEQTAPTVIAPAPAAPEAPAAPTTATAKPPKAPKQPDAPLSPEQAAAMLQTIEDRARQGGWTKGLRKRRDEMQAIVDAARQQSQEAARAEAAAQPDVSPMPVTDGTGADDNAAGTQRDPVSGIQAGNAPTGRPALGSLGEGVVDATAAGDGNPAVAPQQPAQAAKIEPAKPQATGQGVQGGQAAKPATGRATVDYPNRKLGLRYAAADAPIDGFGDSSDASLGNIALANSREGDQIPGYGTVLKVTDKQIQITKPDGNIKRISANSAEMDKLAREVGSLIASSANLGPERLGSLMDMAERDPALTYRNGVPQRFDDAAEQANRGDRGGRASILRPISPAPAPAPVADDAPTPAPVADSASQAKPVAASPAAEGQAPQTPKPEDKAASRKASIKAQLAEAMTRPAETHTTKAGKALKGYILPDATPGEAKDIDKYAFRKTGNVKAGWFVREDAVRALMGEAETATAQKSLAERLNFSQNTPKDQKKAAEAERVELLERVKKEEPNVSGMKARDYLTPEEDEWLTKRGYILGGKGLTLKGEDALSSAKFHMAELEKAEKVAPQAEQPAADAEPAQTSLQSEITAAAAEADPEPTEAQIEAGNYRKGHAVWNGLNLTIENAKGSERSGTDPDGEAWSVTMPAHYGYFRMTEGADGEHIDFYMGDVPESDYVLIIDQAHSDTGKFDEHKVMLGFTSRGAALDAYRAAFSDGRGNDRIGGFMETNVATTKAWLESTKEPSFDATKPVKPMDFPFKRKAAKEDQKGPEGNESRDTRAELKRLGPVWNKMDAQDRYDAVIRSKLAGINRDGGDVNVRVLAGKKWIDLSTKQQEALAWEVQDPESKSQLQPSPAKAQKPAGGYGASNTFITAEQAEKARALIRDKLKNQLNAGIDPDLLAAGIQIAAFHIEAGARRFASAAKAIADDLGMTTEQLRPYLRGWYNGARDTMQDSGLPVDGMDDADTVARAAGAMAQAEIEPEAVRGAAKGVTTQRLSSEDVARITTDAKTFQYKDNADESGVTERLQGVTDWDEVSAMGGMVYQYADGRMVVADGHQRLGLAKRLQASGVKTPWTVAVYRQADGFTAEKVRHFAALKNIREGSGTAIDAAKVLRAAPNDPGVMNLPPKSALVRDARALAKLSDDAFGMVINEVASIGYGAAVGSNVADQKAHKDVLGLLVKLKPANQRQAEMIAEQAAAATTTEVQTSLFGDEEVSESLYLERAKVLDNALSRIRQDRATFKVLADRAGTIAEEGNVLNQEANSRRVENDARVQAYLTAEANRKGPISDALTAAARKLKAEPRSIARITDEFIKAAGSAQLDGGRGRLDGATDDRAGGATEGLRQEARDAGVERDSAQDSDRGNQTLSLFGDEPAAAPAVAEPEVKTVSPDTFRNWKKSLPSTGSTRGWTVFDDTATGGSWVLMSTDLMARPFASETEARAWASENPEDKAGPEDRPTTYPTTLEEVAQKPRPGEGRLTHIYAEYRGARYYIGAVTGNADNAAAEWRKTYPQAGIYMTDRADGTSINGQINELDAAIKDAEQPMFEPGAEGLAQAVIPGAERSEDQRLKQIAEAKRREAEARMAQSKIRRGDQKRVEDDEGGLFGEPKRDLFDAPPARPKPATASSTYADARAWAEDVIARLRDKMVQTGTIQNISLSRNRIARLTRPDEIDESLRATASGVIEFLSGKSWLAIGVNEADALAESVGMPARFEAVPPVDRPEAMSVADQIDAAAEAQGVEISGDERGQIIAKMADDENAADAVKAFVAKRGARAKPGKIEDFGEKIGGARKDVWAGFKEKMQEAEGLDVAAEPLSKSWPEPDYEKLIEGGIDPWTVGFIRAARDMIPRKPAKSWKLKGWAEQVKTLRKFASDILNGKIEQDRLKEKLASMPDLNRKIGGRIALYDAVGHSKSLKDLSFGEHTYSMLGGVRFDKNKSFWEVTKEQAATAFSNFPKVLARAETREEAIALFKAIFPTLDQGGAPKGNKGKGTKFLIYSQRGESGPKYRIGVKIGRNYIDLRTGIADVTEARRIVNEEADQLQAQLDRMRDIPNERRDENAPRIGADHRNGADVTPQQFGDAFGFRGVEFGNWVEDTRRQEDLNNAYDAMMDLAAILDLPPKAMSLNGSLGLAFGARGSGGKNPAAAHFEPGKVVINLTKRSGRGSLAHEWFHALDNYFARKREQMRGNYITDNLAPGSSPTNAGVRPEVIDAFSAVKRAIMATDLKARSQNIDKLRSDPYWGTGIEMHARAFESYVIAKLEDQGGANDYLANIVNGTMWGMMAEASGLGDSYPYLKPNEIETARPKFDALFQTIETRETDRGVEMYMADPDAEPVATLTGDELGAWTDIRDLGRKAEAWYRQNLVGTTVTNAATGMSVQFRSEGARKVGGRKGDVLMRIVPAIREIVERGTLILTERDAKGNADVVAWHTIRATVMLEGLPRDVVVKVKETRDGNFHYDLSRDVSDGARHMVASGRGDESAIGLEDNPVAVNIDFAEPSIKAVASTSLRPIATEVARAMKAHGLAGKITPRLVRVLLGKTGVPIQGRYRAGEIDIRQDAADPRGVLFHEIIHALRDGALWGGDFGLFKREEWHALVKAVRADEELMARVRKAYPDLAPAKQIEEAVAEMYREWATNRAEASTFARVFNRIRTLFLAMGRALRGEGYVDAAVAMERIASGRVGGRGPQGPGGKRGAGSEMRAFHGTPHVFDRFSLDKIGSGEGAQAFGWGLYFADMKDVARSYREDLTKRKVVLTEGSDGSNTEADVLDFIAFNFSKAMDEEHPSEISRETLEAWADMLEDDGDTDGANVLRRINPAKLDFAKGRIMEVEIPEEGELLDWDVPLSKQPASVQAKLKPLVDMIATMPDKNGPVNRARDAVVSGEGTGWQLYGRLSAFFKDKAYADGQALTAEMNRTGAGWTADNLARNAEIEDRYQNPDRAASIALRDAGVPGHRFLDGRSRSPGEGSRNYVIYDDSRVDVVAAEMRAALSQTAAKAKGMIGSAHWKDPGEWISNVLTDRLTAGDGKMSILALVPGRALFSELGRNLSSAKRFLKAKDAMDALRNEWHAKAAGVMEKWYNAGAKNAEAREAMHDLMHRSTIAGVDPSQPDTWRHALQTAAERDISENGEDGAQDWALAVMEQVAAHKRAYAEVRRMYDALPAEFQKLYVEAKQTLTDLADDMDQAVMDNVQNAIRLSIKRAERAHRKEMERIRDEGMAGAERDEAIAKANEALAKAKKQGGWAAKSKVASMRKQFESNRLKGPYFPLARFGQYFVTVRDENGEVISFSRFERETQQKTHIKEMEALHPGRVTFGTLEQKGGLRGQVDPRFVADVEKLLRDTGADPDLMDAVWQRYLETLPDLSVRKSKIHRKGRVGWNRDALRAFASHTMHGSHQLARLKYGLELEDALDDAFDEAKKAANPNRTMAIVNEMQRRKDWIMNPQGAAWSAAASSIAFVWYLGVSPAAALVNLSQTTVIGPAVMKARFKGASVTGILSEIARATKDFSHGQGVSWKETWSATNAPGLTADERAALEEGYKRGTIDKTQAHDLATVAESGVEFNPLREKWMRRIGWAFHHAERVNREVTMLAAYRLARKDGIPHDLAIEAAIDMTWKTHFSYQNSDRPRFMQGDIEKVLFTFRQYTVNLLFRLFRDAHQSLNGATKEERAEAKTQLVGITLSMMAHAGIKGVWGYGLLMMLLGIFFPGGDDDAEKWLQDALLVEGDGLGAAAWNYAMGAVLNGVPGRVLGVDLSERIGSPNLWFRGSDRDLEGEDLLQSYVNETLGPTVGIMFSLARSGQNLAEGEVVRGIEGAVPKFVRDIIRTGRYAADGVRTKKGDIVVEDMNPLELLMQANGFTPARVAERYDINSRLKNAEARLVDERSKIQQAAGDGIRSGDGIPADVAEKIARWNREYPEYPITVDTIRQSLRSRMQASERNEAGVSINPKLDRRLRDAEPPMMFN